MRNTLLPNALVNSLINGVASDYLNINDRAIHYGDGIFETILCQAGKLIFWQRHFKRLQASAEKVKLSCPQEQQLLDDIALLLASKQCSEKHNYAIKIILSRGIGERGYAFDKNINGNRLLFISKIDDNHSSLLSGRLLSGDLFLCEQQVSINENLAGIKHLNRLENVLARDEWRDNKYIDGLMQNANQQVIEGTMSNLFAIKDKQLFTPDLTLSGVNGIIRDVVIDIARMNKIDVTIKALNLAEVTQMDALFISNSLIGVKSVVAFNDSQYKEDVITHTIFDDLLRSLLTTEGNYVQAV